MLSEATTAPFYAVLGDRVGRRPVIIVLIFLFGLLGMAYGFVTSVWMAILGRFASTKTRLVLRALLAYAQWDASSDALS